MSTQPRPPGTGPHDRRCERCGAETEVVSRRHGGLGVIVTVVRCRPCGRAARIETETPRLVTDRFRRSEQRRLSDLAVMRAQEARFVALLHAGKVTPGMFAP